MFLIPFCVVLCTYINKKIYFSLLYVLISLSLLSLTGRYFHYFVGYTDIPVLSFMQSAFAEEFNLDREGNIPTYFSGILLLLSSVLLFVIYRTKRKIGSPFYRYWFGLSMIFAYMSIDEVASLHERAIGTLRYMLGADGIFYFAWVIPAAVGLLLLGIVYARFLWHLQVRWKGLFAIAATLYVGGALGVELVGGWYASNYGTESFIYALITTVEETLEMGGAAFFIYALFDHLSSLVERVNILFQ